MKGLYSSDEISLITIPHGTYNLPPQQMNFKNVQQTIQSTSESSTGESFPGVVLSDDYIQNLLNQIQNDKKEVKQPSQKQQHHCFLKSSMNVGNNITDFQRLQDFSHKRVLTDDCTFEKAWNDEELMINTSAINLYKPTNESQATQKEFSSSGSQIEGKFTHQYFQNGITLKDKLQPKDVSSVLKNEGASPYTEHNNIIKNSSFGDCQSNGQTNQPGKQYCFTKQNIPLIEGKIVQRNEDTFESINRNEIMQPPSIFYRGKPNHTNPNENPIQEYLHMSKSDILTANISGLKRTLPISYQHESEKGSFSESKRSEQVQKRERCEECIVLKQQMNFLEMQLKESQEREENYRKMNDTLMEAFSQVKSEDEKSDSSQKWKDMLHVQYESELERVREQMKERNKQQQSTSKELVQKYDELEDLKDTLELQLNNLKREYDLQSHQLNEKISASRIHENAIRSLEEMNKSLHNRLKSLEDFTKQDNLSVEQLSRKHANEMHQIQTESQREIERLNLVIKNTIQSMEGRICVLIDEKMLLEKSNATNTQVCSDLRQKLTEECTKLRHSRDLAILQLEEKQKNLDKSKIQSAAQASLLAQLKEQENTIERLQGLSAAHEALQIQHAQLSANLAHFQLKVQQLDQEKRDLKARRESDKKHEAAKYSELQAKLEEQDLAQNKLKKDFQRKSAMIIREILNKDIKIKQLSSKVQTIHSSSNVSNYSNSINSGHTSKRDKSPFSKFIHDEKILSEHPQFIEFNKSNFLSPPPLSQETCPNSMNGKNSLVLEGERTQNIETYIAMSRSPVGRGVNVQQFWQNLMDSSSLSNENMLSGAPYTGGEDVQLGSGELKNRLYQSIVQQRSVLEESLNEMKIQLNNKNEHELLLKTEIRFLVEHLLKTLAERAAVDLLANLNENEGQQNKVLQNAQQEEERLIKETDKILKRHIIHLQQKAINSNMMECNKVLNLIMKENQQNQIEQLPLKVEESRTHQNKDSSTLLKSSVKSDKLKHTNESFQDFQVKNIKHSMTQRLLYSTNDPSPIRSRRPQLKLSDLKEDVTKKQVNKTPPPNNRSFLNLTPTGSKKQPNKFASFFNKQMNGSSSPNIQLNTKDHSYNNNSRM